MKKTILLIDDNPDDLEFYADLLKQIQDDYEILTAENGADGLKIFSQKKIYCAFVDYNLPEMNGLKILERFNEQSQGGVLPIVILTGEPNQKIQAQAARKGALNYLVKDTTNTSVQLQAVIKKTVAWAVALNQKVPLSR